MNLAPEHLYQAVVSRDHRFDGVFYVGVQSTGIYCRTICPSRRPAYRHCRFFRHAVLAEVAGFRPCLRCRPEQAPGHATVDAWHRHSDRLVRVLDQGVFRDHRVPAVARLFGLSDRQFRRATLQAYGVSPVEIAQTQRLLFAKQLLSDTALPIGQVALASGFGSLRRFNALFAGRYRLTPSEVRSSRRASPAGQWITCRLAYRPPFDWEGLLAFLRVRAIPRVERVTSSTYERTAAWNGAAGLIRVSHRPEARAVAVSVTPSLVPVLGRVVTRVRRLLDLDAHPERISQHLADLPDYLPGTRLPGAFDAFEVSVRAILGQQVSVRAATTLAGRLANRFGTCVNTGDEELNGTMPSASVLAVLEPGELAGLGILPARAAAILALAREVASGRLVLEFSSAPIDVTLARLKMLPGVGEWTAQYLAMRALHWPDAFPALDLGIRRALGNLSAAAVLQRAQFWRPWRAYAAIHLWRTSPP
ncbi:MAG TPA: AlkA N-terminal domain-containing protein [Chthoniobacterales bacterium]